MQSRATKGQADTWPAEFEDIAGFDATRLMQGYQYDREKGDKAVGFFHEILTHTKSGFATDAGQAFVLERWQQTLLRAAFGIVDNQGRRRFRQLWLEIPRKNGKTTLAAGIALYGLVADGEVGAELYCAAADRNQASLLFGIAEQMVTNSDLLSDHCLVTPSKKQIAYRQNVLQAISSEAGSKHGYNSHIILADEVHAWYGRELWDVLQTSTGARRQPLMIGITTAGHDRSSLCYEVHEYACKVRDGLVDDPTFLPVVYGADDTDDWRSPTTWRKANPNLGVSIDESYLEKECRRAETTPAYQNTFRRLHLNQWTQQSTRWIDINRWFENPREDFEFDGREYTFGGLDLSSTTDLTSWCVLQITSTGGLRAKWRHYIPEGGLEKAMKTDRVPYDQWQREGWLTVTPGERVDYSRVEADIVADVNEYDVYALGYDPWNAENTQQHLARDTACKVIKVSQSFRFLNEPCKYFEAAVASRQVWNGANPIVDWMVENVEVQSDASGNMRPAKPEAKAGAKRIDGIAAMCNALAIAFQFPSNNGEAIAGII